MNDWFQVGQRIAPKDGHWPPSIVTRVRDAGRDVDTMNDVVGYDCVFHLSSDNDPLWIVVAPTPTPDSRWSNGRAEVEVQDYSGMLIVEVPEPHPLDTNRVLFTGSVITVARWLLDCGFEYVTEAGAGEAR